MKSRATRRFWDAYRDLPSEIQDLSRKAYRLFRENAAHPSLHFKKIHDSEPIYAVRITIGYRALGLVDGDEITWFWIGTHTVITSGFSQGISVTFVVPTAWPVSRRASQRSAAAAC